MMKVCIITQPLHNNYGGILQNYALQRVLRDMGVEPITIDYIKRQPSCLRIVVSACKTFLLLCIGKKRPFLRRNIRSKENNRFIGKYINSTKSVSYYSVDIVIEEKAGAIIVGSDQVWRVKYNRDTIDDMFLKFLKNYPIKRIAYAASFGVDNIQEYTQEQITEYKKLLSEFDLVTVRESTGVDLCEKYFGVSAKMVLDPTMLLDKSAYLELCMEIPVNKTGFLAAYILDITQEKENIITKVAKQRNLKVKYFTADTKSILSIEKWLAMFRDAEYIVTDSFHGTAFSIIFNKQFYVLANDKRGNSRFDSLLSLMNLTSRQVKTISDLSDDTIDWENVNKIRNQLSFFSKKILSEKLLQC